MSTTSIKPVQIGLIGCGRVGRLHLEGYRRHGARVVAVTDSDPQRAQAWAAELGAVAYPDPAAMVDGAQLDAVDICSPPAAHLANFALAAGRVSHIFLEKPMAQDLASCHQIMEVAARTGVRAMIGFFHRYYQPLLTLREMLAAGELGRVVTVRIRFLLEADRENPRTWLWDRQMAGGGAMVHTMSHALDLFRFLVGEVSTMSAHVAQVDPQLPLEDTAIVTVQAHTGAIGILEAYGNAPFVQYLVEAQGTAAAAWVGYFPPSLHLRRQGETVPTALPVAETDPNHRIYDAMGAFVAAVRGNEVPALGLDDGLKAMELVTAAYRAVGQNGISAAAPTTGTAGP